LDHWSECINIWRVTSFGHRFIKEYIWPKPGERYRPTGPLITAHYKYIKHKNFCNVRTY